MHEFFQDLLNFLSDPTTAISQLIAKFDNWIYFLLFFIIFAETGLIILSFIMPFLPGDALLFAVGIISAKGELNIYLIIPLLIFAAILGDNVNYVIGRKFGNWLLTQEKVLFLKPKHLKKAEDFFQKNGKKSIIMARFIPVVRTIVPFISGATRLSYSVFLLYSLIGAVLWVGLLVILGFSLGQFEIVKNNVEKVIILIIILANIPLIKQLLMKKSPEKLFGLIGKNISYSFSKGYFTDKFKKLSLKNHTYEVFDFQKLTDLKAELFSKDNLSGCNITIPYKQEIIPFLDELSPEAKQIGAVNTIQFKNGKKIGHNTDVIGFKNSFIPLLESHHKKALILGNGGASKAVEFVLNELNIPYLIVSRSGNFKFESLNETILKEYQIIINTTPIGTFPNVENIPLIPTEFISKNHLVYDLVYNPEQTKLLKVSEQKGAKIKNGLEMLHGQADAAWEIWNE